MVAARKRSVDDIDDGSIDDIDGGAPVDVDVNDEEPAIVARTAAGKNPSPIGDDDDDEEVGPVVVTVAERSG
jgi:hypothetical protein